MNRLLGPLMGFILAFSALAKGAHDLWAATLVTLAGLFLLVFWLAQAIMDPRSDGNPVFLVIPTLLLIGALGASYAQSVHPQESFMELTDWLVALTFFWVALSAFRSEEAVRGLLVIMVPVFWIQLIVNTFHLVSEPSLGLKSVPATLINPNIAAGFFLFWIPPLIGAIRATQHEPHSLWRRVWILGLVACLINLVLSGSVWAWFCLLGFLPWLIGFDRIRAFRLHQPVFYNAVLLAITFLVGFLLYQKWAELMGPDASGTSRLVWWRAGFHMVMAQPWFGIGLGNYPSAYLAYQVGEGQHTLYPHNIMVGWLAEMGVIGFLAMVLFIGCWSRFVFRTWTPLSRRHPYIFGLALFLVFSLLNLGTEYLINHLLLFTFMAIGVAPAVQRVWTPRLSVLITIGGLAFLLVPFVVSPFLASQDVVYGQEKLKEGNTAEARQAFLSSLDLDNRSWEAKQGLAMIGFNQGKMVEAIQYQREAIQLNRLNGRLHWELGRYYYEAKKWQQAFSSFKKAVQLNKTNKLYRDTFNGMKKELFGL